MTTHPFPSVIVLINYPCEKIAKKAFEMLYAIFRFGEAVMVENLKLVDSQEGISAFIGKKTPVWSHSDDKV